MTRRDAPEADGELHQTVEGYFRAFSALSWDDLPSWPPDVFCLCNLLLDHTEAYRFAVAPPTPGGWPPEPGWNEHVAAAAVEWRASVAEKQGRLPDLVERHWRTVRRSSAVPLSRIRSGEDWELCEALLTLHAAADEACSGLADPAPPRGEESFEARAWAMLRDYGTLSHLSPTRVRVAPKTNFAARGITIRSMSRYLGLFYESVDVKWQRVDVPAGERSSYTVMLLPWPLTVHAEDFRPVGSPLGNMDPDVFGFFEFAPQHRLEPSFVEGLLRSAADKAGAVDAVVLPEDAVLPDELTMLEDLLADHGVTFLVSGVREPPVGDRFGRNYIHFGVRTSTGWERYQQDKHHRWCLDEGQIGQYHLSRRLDPSKQWWEAIDVRARTMHVVDVGGGTTAAPLVCEDLARLDEVHDLLRRIGPSVVVAVLLDGPQLKTRWPCRYATVLAEEPGSSVLTLTSYGMVARSRPAGLPPSRVVALWADNVRGIREIELKRGSSAVLLTAAVEAKQAWTADGRCHRGVPSLVLTDTQQLRAGS